MTRILAERLLRNQRLWKTRPNGCEGEIQAVLVRQQRDQTTAPKNFVILMRNQEQQGLGQQAAEVLWGHRRDFSVIIKVRPASHSSNRALTRPHTTEKVLDSSGRQ